MWPARFRNSKAVGAVFGLTPAKYKSGETEISDFCNSICRYCCKSLFPLGTKNSPGCRRDFRVKMWGSSWPDDKLTGDLGNVIEATQSGDRQLIRVTARKLSPDNFRLLQHEVIPG